jgi:hypothetical protein
LLSWIQLLISKGAIMSNNSYFLPLFLHLYLCYYHYFLLSVTLSILTLITNNTSAYFHCVT